MSVTQLFSNLRNKKAKRAGRGISGNLGKTAGRGTKGQKARAGSGRKISTWFEGGQTPLYRRIAKKKGFNHRVTKPQTVTTDLINRFYKDGEIVSVATLIEKNIFRSTDTKAGVKIVLRRPLEHKVTFEGVKLSKSLQQ